MTVFCRKNLLFLKLSIYSLYIYFLHIVFQSVKYIEIITLWLQFVDDGGVPGFNLGQMILNDPAANISLYGTLLSVYAYIVVFYIILIHVYSSVKNIYITTCM